MAETMRPIPPRSSGIPVAVWAIGALALGVGGVLWFRHGKAGASAAASAQDQYASTDLGGGSGGAGGSTDTSDPASDPYSGSAGTYYGSADPVPSYSAPAPTSSTYYAAPQSTTTTTGGYTVPSNTQLLSGNLSPVQQQYVNSNFGRTATIQPVGGFTTVTSPTYTQSAPTILNKFG